MAPTRDKLPLALTMGDPAGIGPDLTLTAWTRRDEDALPSFFALGDPELYEERARALGLTVPVREVEDGTAAAALFAEALPVFPIPLSAPALPGTPDPAWGAAVIESIETGVALVHAGAAAALVTNPINKAVLYDAGFRHPGHTEFLGALSAPWGVTPRPEMMLACDALKVVPITVHMALRDVPTALSTARIVQAVETTARGMADLFGVSAPRIAVTGLNPHAGEGGAVGREEIDVIAPAIAELTGRGHRVTGPRAADGLFHAAARATYDVAVTMYHDQALVPIKAIAFDEAVNLTLGLPFIRTSPDHGTAYELAGTGRASPASLAAALRLARRLAARTEAVV